MEISIKRVSCLSSLGFVIVFALACANSGCAVRDGVKCTLWDGCEDGGPDDVEDPFDTYDPDFPEDAAADPTPDTGSPAPDAQPCCAPTDAPVFAIVALPTAVLTGGSNAIHRLTVTAVNEDVHLKKMTFSACSTSPSGEISSPALREVGMGSDLPGVADVTLDPEGCGTGNSLYKVTVTLATPYAIAANQSRTFDLLVTVLAFQSGESLTTGVREDLDGPACGSLTGTGSGTGTAGMVQNLIWSHDLVTWHNGDAIDWSPAGAQTMTAP